MSEKYNLISHCIHVSQLSDNEARLISLRNMENEIAMSISEPYCTTFSDQPTPKVREWIPLSETRLLFGFDFPHHSKEDIVDFAVKNRGNYRLWLDDMNGFQLNEFPAPSASGKVYMVSDNGNHRRLAFSCVGLPKVSASVQKMTGNKWSYFIGRRNWNALMLLKWLKYKGIIDCIELDQDDTRAFVISDANNISGWIMPNPNLPDLKDMICDMQNRTNLLKKSFSGIDDKVSALLRSPNILYLSIQFTFSRRKIPCIIDNMVKF